MLVSIIRKSSSWNKTSVETAKYHIENQRNFSGILVVCVYHTFYDGQFLAHYFSYPNWDLVLKELICAWGCYPLKG